MGPRCLRSVATSVFALALLLTASVAWADLQTPLEWIGSLNMPNAALSPYAGPYASIDITLANNTTDTATVTFTALVNGGNQYLFVDGNSVGLALTTTDVTLGALGATTLNSDFHSPCFGPPQCGGGSFSLTPSLGLTNVSSVGSYNLTLTNFDSFDWALDTISFTLTKNDGTAWGSVANIIDLNLNPGTGSWVEAHIAVCTDPNNCSPATAAAATTGFTGGNVNVPEPGTVALLGSGVLVLGTLARRFRK